MGYYNRAKRNRNSSYEKEADVEDLIQRVWDNHAEESELKKFTQYKSYNSKAYSDEKWIGRVYYDYRREKLMNSKGKYVTRQRYQGLDYRKKLIKLKKEVLNIGCESYAKSCNQFCENNGTVVNENEGLCKQKYTGNKIIPENQCRKYAESVNKKAGIFIRNSIHYPKGCIHETDYDEIFYNHGNYKDKLETKESKTKKYKTIVFTEQGAKKEAARILVELNKAKKDVLAELEQDINKQHITDAHRKAVQDSTDIDQVNQAKTKAIKESQLIKAKADVLADLEADINKKYITDAHKKAVQDSKDINQVNQAKTKAKKEAALEAKKFKTKISSEGFQDKSITKEQCEK